MSDLNIDIWRLQAQSNVRGLLEFARHQNADVRKRAVAALRALGTTSAIPGLQMILAKEPDPDVRAAIILTLDHLFQQEVDDEDDSAEEQHTRSVRLIAQLSSRQPEAIIEAARQLGDLKEKLAAEPLIMLFHNPQMPASARYAAAEALLKLESAPVEVVLLGALRHRDWRVRRNAAAVLAQLDADWAVEPLRLALSDEQEMVRRTAQAALKHIGTPEALQALEPPPAPPSLVTVIPLPATTTPPPDLPPAPPAEQPPAPIVEPPIDEEETQPITPIFSDDVS